MKDLLDLLTYDNEASMLFQIFFGVFAVFPKDGKTHTVLQMYICTHVTTTDPTAHQHEAQCHLDVFTRTCAHAARMPRSISCRERANFFNCSCLHTH
jgi:hypothetical protein